MSQSIQMRTTTEQSGDYRIFAAKNDEPVKGLALHTDLLDRLDGEPDYVEVTFDTDAALALNAEKFTGATFRASNKPAVRSAYFEPWFVADMGYDGDMPTEETFDVDGFPDLGISNIELSDEDSYDEAQNSSAEEAADALFGESDDSDESEAEAEEVEISDDELEIAGE